MLRRMTLNSEMKNEISRQLIVQVFTFKILFNLCILDSVDIDNDLTNSNANSDADLINSMFKTRDIYNLKTQLRRDALDSLTSMQVLIRELNESD